MGNMFSVNLKRKVSIGLAFLMVATNLMLVPIAKAVATPSLTIGSQSASNGQIINVPVTANFIDVQGVDLSINYPGDLLTYVGCSSSHIVCSTDVVSTTNKINVLWYDVVNFLNLNDEALLTLQFQVNTTNVIDANLTFSPNVISVGDGFDTEITSSVVFNSGIISLNPPATLSSIAISNPANKLTYTTGDVLDISGLEITGTYSDSTVNVETITTANVSGFDSSVPAVGQILTVTVGGATTSYTIDVVDNVKPIISLLGSNPVNLIVGDSYSDAGATASDDVDGNLTANIVTSNTVNANVVGSYTVTYNVVDAAGNIATQVSRTVNVSATPLSSAKDITSFSFPEGLGSIVGNDISIVVPFGTDVSNLTSNISISPAATINDHSVVQDFTTPVNYTVTAEDGSTKIYTVTVSIAANTEAKILSFNSSAPIANGVISGSNITLTVPFGTSLVDLPITITLSSGATVLPIAGNTSFIDGTPVSYTVTAEDGATTQNYLVTVNVAANSAKDITSFNFENLIPSASGVIAGNNITLDVPFGTNVSTLVPTVGITGFSINPVSGGLQDFTSPVTYTVTAADGSTQDYVVTVIVAFPSDLTTLNTLISTAQGKHDVAIEGNITGQYPSPLKANLQTAINTASAITNVSSQSVVDAAVVTLNNAILTFEAGVVPSDIAAPVITLLGSSIVNVTVGDTYIDAGATAQDVRDGNITGNIIIVNLVDMNTIGTYTVTYNVSDAAGNNAVQVTRTVNVKAVPATLSSIAITTPATKLAYATGDTLDISGLEITGTYSDSTTILETITTTSISGFNSSAPVIGQVLTITVGGKTTSYTIDVVDNVKPIITLIGNNSISLYVGDSYIDTGATANDNVDGNITSKIVTVNNVNTSVVGTYNITYNVSDVAGNSAVQVTRTIIVSTRPSSGGGSGGSYSYTPPVIIPQTVTTTQPIIEPIVVVTSTGQVLGIKTTLIDELIAKLKFRQTSLEVNKLQNELKRLGFFSKNFKTTKYYGEMTVNAVAKYKISQKVVTDPVVVQVSKVQTLDDLIALTKFGTKNNNVRLLQTELKKLGYYPKAYAITNYYGPLTNASVKKYLAAIK